MLIIKDSSLLGLMQLMAKALNGTHIDDPRVIYVKAKDVTVKPLDPNDRLMINLDGNTVACPDGIP